MPVGFYGTLLDLPTQCKTIPAIIPAIENRAQFLRAFDTPQVGAVLLRHCNLFELAGLLERAHQRKIATYVNVDSIDGIHADNAGLRYLAERLFITGVVSNHARVLSAGKGFGLETIQRIFALDSTGLEATLQSVDTTYVDLLDISPGLVVPHIMPQLRVLLPRPFIASGLIQTSEQIQAILHAGACGVVVARNDLWTYN
jgi:glycerol uptake operon antiterminator